MTNLDPSWSLTDDALILILHAENDISDKPTAHQGVSSMTRGQLGGSITPELWRQETAVLRLISTVEAYTNAASELFLTMKSSAVPPPPFTWPQRRKYYTKQHGIDLAARAGWMQVEAGIDLRNCLAHGLGNLTDILLHQENLGQRMKQIGVSVGGNRMHPTAATVPTLAAGCRSFVLDIENELVAQL